MENKKLKVAVVGGGWNGLYALKWLKNEKWADVTLFEKDYDIGGVWLYRPNRPGGVFENTHTTASKAYLHASDFPMPDSTAHFPHHKEVLAYLHSYCTNFKLWDNIKLNTSVLSIRKNEQTGKWHIKTFAAD